MLRDKLNAAIVEELKRQSVGDFMHDRGTGAIRFDGVLDVGKIVDLVIEECALFAAGGQVDIGNCVLTCPGNLSDEQMQSIREAFDEWKRRPPATRGPLIMEGFSLLGHVR